MGVSYYGGNSLIIFLFVVGGGGGGGGSVIIGYRYYVDALLSLSNSMIYIENDVDDILILY